MGAGFFDFCASRCFCTFCASCGGASDAGIGMWVARSTCQTSKRTRGQRSSVWGPQFYTHHVPHHDAFLCVSPLKVHHLGTHGFCCTMRARGLSHLLEHSLRYRNKSNVLQNMNARTPTGDRGGNGMTKSLLPLPAHVARVRGEQGYTRPKSRSGARRRPNAFARVPTNVREDDTWCGLQPGGGNGMVAKLRGKPRGPMAAGAP